MTAAEDMRAYRWVLGGRGRRGKEREGERGSRGSRGAAGGQEGEEGEGKMGEARMGGPWRDRSRGNRPLYNNVAHTGAVVVRCHHSHACRRST
jgi:hypothetical protein